ncbi:MAG: hypothetical protein F4051_14240 [Boseongicola sp. SB0670_bin_30]|nr:hypothetical protein [Boseongicola sp. SB0670_bin_30]
MTTELQERATAFMDANPVFRRDEFAAAMDLPKSSSAVGRLLRQQVAAKRIRRLRREVFAAVPDHKTPGRLVLPDYIHASKYRTDGVLGYHTGLRLFGIQYSVTVSQVQVISNGPAGYARTPFGRCRFIKPHRALVDAGKTDFLTVRKEPAGIPVRVTAFERTLVDVLHRPGRAGGRDEVIDSLATAPYVLRSFDPGKVADYVELLGIRSLAGVVGWWLESWRSELDVHERVLDRLRAMLPDWHSYWLRARPGKATLVRPWRVYIPTDDVDPTCQGFPPHEWPRRQWQ